MIRFVVDSASDNLCRELLERDRTFFPEYEVKVVPLVIYTDEVSYRDDAALQVSEMISDMEKYQGRSYTSCPTVDSWLEAFRGAKEICAVTITSGLSGSFNSAVAAKEMYLQECPDAKVEIIDSLSTGPGMRLPLEKMMEYGRKGLTIEEICLLTREYIKTLHTYCALQSLHNLAANGRVSRLVEKAVGVLGIHIIGIASPEGGINLLTKIRGVKKTLAEVLKQMEERGYKGGKLRICYVETSDMAEQIIQAVKSKYGEVDACLYPARGLCSFYAERDGVIISCEC